MLTAFRTLCAAAIAATTLPAHAAVDRIFDDGFQAHVTLHIQSPAIPIAAGDRQMVCYFFTMPNAAAVGVTRWLSHLDPGIHHAILFTTQTAAAPDGTVTAASPCGTFPNQPSSWLYASHDADEDLLFPSNDGTGKPLALTVAAGQPAFLQIYLANDTTQPLTPAVTIAGEGIDPSRSYTATAAYMTTNTAISISPGSSGVTVQNTCSAPSGASFWWLSTRTHHYATESRLSDGASPLVISTDWEHPTVARPVPFHAFASGITTTCTYDNPGGATVPFGDSESTDEVCMGVGYFFPAPTGGKYCVNTTGPL